MKIRNGFVSNSSSSSFCLFGIYVDHTTILEKLKEFAGTDDLGDETDVYTAGEFLAEKMGVEFEYGPSECYGSYFGRSPQSLKDEETGAQFKESVKVAVEKFFPGQQPAWHEEGWYDG